MAPRSQAYNLGVQEPVTTDMRANHEFDVCFEVTADVLYVLGRTLLRGDYLRADELGDLATCLESLGMLRRIQSDRWAA